MRRAVVVAITIAMVMPFASSPDVARAGGRRTTFVLVDCRHLRTTPSAILFACGDGNFFVDHLTWTRWRTWKAAGWGLFHQNDCRPSCAEGTFHTEWGRIWLRHRERCNPPGRSVFQHVRIVFSGRLLGRHRDAFGHMGCPFHV